MAIGCDFGGSVIALVVLVVVGASLNLFTHFMAYVLGQRKALLRLGYSEEAARRQIEGASWVFPPHKKAR